MIVLYQHKRADNGDVFYVGVGKPERAYDKYKRNQHWKNVSNKYGFVVEILKTDLSKEDAAFWERYFIGLYGRKDLGNGVLVNMTDGGFGKPGKITNENTIKKIRAVSKGRKMSFEARQNISRSKTGNPNPSAIETNKKRILDKNPNAKKVINNVDKTIFNCAKAAAEYYGINYNTLRNKLCGTKYNNTNLEYIDNLNQ